MAVTFPRALDVFQDEMQIISATFHMPAAVHADETAGGDALSVAYGPSLWRGSFTVAPRQAVSGDELVAKIEHIMQPGGSFLVTPPWRKGPAFDHQGGSIAGFAPTLQSVWPNGTDIEVNGLPSGYQLRPGDFIGWTYGSNPTRYALHRVARTRVATAAGYIERLELTTPPRAGWTVGTALTFVRPVCKAHIIRGSLRPAAIAGKVDRGFTFEWRQTLK